MLKSYTVRISFVLALLLSGICYPVFSIEYGKYYIDISTNNNTISIVSNKTTHSFVKPNPITSGMYRIVKKDNFFIIGYGVSSNINTYKVLTFVVNPNFCHVKVINLV